MCSPILEISAFASIFLVAARAGDGLPITTPLSILASYDLEANKYVFDMGFRELTEAPTKIYDTGLIKIKIDQQTAEQLIGASLEMDNGNCIFRHKKFDTTGIEDLIVYN